MRIPLLAILVALPAMRCHAQAHTFNAGISIALPAEESNRSRESFTPGVTLSVYQPRLVIMGRYSRPRYEGFARDFEPNQYDLSFAMLTRSKPALYLGPMVRFGQLGRLRGEAFGARGGLSYRLGQARLEVGAELFDLRRNRAQELWIVVAANYTLHTFN